MTPKNKKYSSFNSQKQVQTGREWLDVANDFLKKNQLEEAAIYVKKAIEIFEEEGDTLQYIEARSWNIYIYRSLHSRDVLEHTEAYVEETIRLCRQLIPPIHKVSYYVLTEVSSFYADIDQLEKGLGYALEQLEVAEKLFDNLDEGVIEAHRNVSVIYQFLGNYPKSIEYGLRAFQKCEQKGDKLKLIKVSLPLYVNYAKYGDYEKAFIIISKALDAANELKDKGIHMPSYFFVHIYNNIASYYSFTGDYQESFMYYQKAFYARKNQFGEENFRTSLIQRNFGNALIRIGQFEKGLYHLKGALETQQKLRGFKNLDVATSHIAIARYYEKTENYSLSLSHAQNALEIFKTVHKEQHPKIITTQKLVARVQTYLGNHPEAARIFEDLIIQSKSFWGENHIETALTYLDVADHCLQTSQIDIGVKAILISEKIFLKKIESKRNQTGKYFFSNQFFAVTRMKEKIYFQRYLTKGRHEKDLTTVFQSCKDAVNLLDEMRQSYHQESSKLVWSAAESDLFNKGIVIAMEMADELCKNLDSDAFWFSEKAKASLLLNTLQSNSAKTSAHILPERLEEERQMKLQLAYLDKSLQKLEQGNDKQLQEYRDEFFHLRNRYMNFIKQLEIDYPDYYQLKYDTQTVKPTELQKILKENQVIISYFVGKEKLYVFVLTSDDFEVIDLYKPDNFEDLIEVFLGTLTEHHFANFTSKSHQLHQLLIDPIRDFIVDDFRLEEEELKEVFIVPHGALSYLPFEALIGENCWVSQIEDFISTWQNLDYLIHHCKISYHYSATLLYRHLLKKQTIEEEIPNSFGGFAPVYDTRIPQAFEEGVISEKSLPDESLKQSAKTMQAWATRSDAIRSDGTWVSLPHSETEAKGIAQLFEGKGLKSEVFLRNKASKEGFSDAAKRFKFLLVAAHGLVNDEKTALSGLVFYPSDRSDKQEEIGEKQEMKNDTTQPISRFSHSTSETDSVLSMEETHHLDIQADLVVLSSCESGIGTLHKGEGMMAVNRGFLAAGANNVVSTLFKVYDKPSSLLTQYFFEAILEGEGYAAALRLAKLKLMAQPNIDPKSWSGFVLIGS